MFLTHRQSIDAGMLYGLVGVILFGLTLPCMLLAIRELDVVFTGLGRAIPAAILAGVVLLLTKTPFPERWLWREIFITSAGVVVGFPLFATLAMKYTTASYGGVFLSALPLATTIAGIFFANERPSRGFWLTAIAGCLIVAVFAYSLKSDVSSFEWGNLFLVLAVISAAIGYASGGQLSKELGGWQVICWALVFGVPFIIPVVYFFAEPIQWSVSPSSWGAFIYLALVSQFLAFFFWNKGLAIGGVAKVSQVQLLQVFVTLAGSALLLGEAVSVYHFVFAVLVTGIVFFSKKMDVRTSDKK